jgi:hypothetical protein
MFLQAMFLQVMQIWMDVCRSGMMLPALGVLGVHRAGLNEEPSVRLSRASAPNRLRGAPPGGMLRAMAGLLARGSPPHAAFPVAGICQLPVASSQEAHRLQLRGQLRHWLDVSTWISISILIRALNVAPHRIPYSPPFGGTIAEAR